VPPSFILSGAVDLAVGLNPLTDNKLIRWGQTPWTINFRPQLPLLPDRVDIAIVGGGFSGLSAAANIRRFDSRKTVAVFEAENIGARSSGRTGGLALAETAAGNLPGLGDVLGGVSNILRDLQIDCDLRLPGAWELDRTTSASDSPVRWSDTGELRVAKEVPGGTLDAGKLVSGLARAAEAAGAAIFEYTPVENVDFGEPPVLHVRDRGLRADRVLFATNSESLELTGLAGHAEPKLTLALATEPLPDETLKALGLDAGKPCYTTDLPYLWGRLLHGNQIIFGSGLVEVDTWKDLVSIDVGSGRAFELMSRLQTRVSGLHPSLQNVMFSHRWGGPILIADQWRPVFARHPKNSRSIVLGAYSGHGVALSVYLGAWAAQALLEKRELPIWNARYGAAK
jgi:gamma-glutamylputrescine oxidase